MRTTIDMLKAMHQAYSNGAWQPGSYRWPDEHSPLGYRGCLVGISTLLEQRECGYHQLEVTRLCLEDSPKLLPLAYAAVEAIAQDPEVVAFYKAWGPGHDGLERFAEWQRGDLPLRPAEAYNDKLAYQLARERVGEANTIPGESELDVARGRVLAAIERTIARLEEQQPGVPLQPQREAELRQPVMA